MPGRVAEIVEQLGVDICSGAIETHTPLTADDIQRLTDSSRSVVREAVGILSNLGLLRARRRIGFEVRPRAEWNMLAPEVVRWRLIARDGVEDELTALRRTIEPTAAAEAASFPAAHAEIARASAELWEAAAVGDHPRFLAADHRMHRGILGASGNTLFIAIGSLLTEALPARARHAHEIDLDEARRHLDLAAAISRGDASASAELMRTIVEAPAGHDRTAP